MKVKKPERAPSPEDIAFAGHLFDVAMSAGGAKTGVVLFSMAKEVARRRRKLVRAAIRKRVLGPEA